MARSYKEKALAIDHVDRTIVVAGPKVVATEATMKAIVQSRYGAPGQVLELREMTRPVAKDDEVLVRVRAASVHVGDVILARGLPYFLRMMTGLRRPKNPIPGTDIAGTVEAVGREQIRDTRIGGDACPQWGPNGFIKEIAPGDQLDPRIAREQAIGARAHPEIVRNTGTQRSGVVPSENLAPHDDDLVGSPWYRLRRPVPQRPSQYSRRLSWPLMTSALLPRGHSTVVRLTAGPASASSSIAVRTSSTAFG